MSQWLMFSAEAQMSEKPFSDGLPEAFRRASGGFFEKSSIPEPIFRAENCGNKKIRLSLHPQQGGLAQQARALSWHARGHEFESRILHHKNGTIFRWSRFSVYASGRIGRTRHKRHKSIRAGLHPQHERKFSGKTTAAAKNDTTKYPAVLADGRICATLPEGVICPGKKP